MAELKDQLSLLGRKTEYKQDYAPEVLEAFDNKHPENDYWVRFNCPEFTSLCPITGQPDFAEIRISYIPDIKMVESKSLKLYLFSFRSHGAFHEDCVNIIMKDLIKLMNPKYIEVTGIFTPRGGISILSVCQLWPSGNEVRTDGGTSADESGVILYSPYFFIQFSMLILGMRARCFTFSVTIIKLQVTAVAPISKSKSSISLPCFFSTALQSP